MANGVEKHHYTVPWVIFAVVVAISIVAFLYWKYQVPEDERGARQETGESSRGFTIGDKTLGDIVSPTTGEMTEQIETLSNPLGGVPSVNPMENTNPFSVKTNPFE